MKKLISLMIMLGVAIAIKAQMVDPVHFTSQLKMLGGDEAEIVFSAKIDKGWHLYSTELGSDGPISASFNANKMDGAETVGKLQPRGKEVKQFDNMFASLKAAPRLCKRYASPNQHTTSTATWNTALATTRCACPRRRWHL